MNKRTSFPAAQWRFAIFAFGTLILFGVLYLGVLPLLYPEWESPTYAYLRDPSSTTTDPLLTARESLASRLAGPIVSAADPGIGPEAAPLTIAVYSDFTCWYCGQTAAAARRVQAEYADRVRVIHKDFPSPNKAYASYQAALAGRCAQRQGLFWEMGDKLYEHYDRLGRETVMDLAEDLTGLNQARFQECMDGRAQPPVTAAIDDNIAEANALGLSGAPAVYVNDKAFLGQMDYEELKGIVETLLR